MGFIARLIGISPIITYVVIGLAGLGIAAWGQRLITAPYRAQIVTLKAETRGLKNAAATKERLAQEDQQRAQAAEADMVRLDLALETLTHDKTPVSCKLSDTELNGLRDLTNPPNTRKR